MATELTYPLFETVKLGLWTICNKVEDKIGIRPGTWANTNGRYFVFHDADLTPEQIADVNAIVNAPDAQGPELDLMIVNNSYIISDIWEHRAEIYAETGVNFKVRYRFSGTIPGAKYPDEIVLIPVGDGALSDAVRILPVNVKNSFVGAIEALNRWE